MKNEFTNQLIYSLCTRFPNIDESVARQIISNILKNYDIKERELTELALPDFTTEILLRAFATYKYSQNIAKGSIDQYVLTARQLCDYIGKPLQHITSDDVIYFLVNYKLDYNCSSHTMENKRINLNSVFNTLYKHKKIDHNPMLLVDSVKYQTQKRVALTEAEIEQIFIACEDNTREMAIVRMLLDTGCRSEEIINIKFSNVDMLRHRIRVTGKGNKERTVMYGGATAIRLQAYLTDRLKREGKTCFSPNDYLFAGMVKPYGKLTKSALRNIVSDIRDKTGIERLHCHLFRHTSATMLVKSGVPIEKVSRYLGHTNINTTMIYITQNTESTLADISRAIA